MNMWKAICGCLQAADFSTFAPGSHTGECTAPYIVVKTGSTAQVGSYSSIDTLYDILCYVPSNKYSSLETFVQTVKTTLKALYPMLVPTYSETASFYDDTVKGHMVSIEYKVHKKI